MSKKKALALVWACERFHVYLYGADFELLTNHKPLEFLFSTKSKPSARIERWVSRLQNYRYIMHHVANRDNIADLLSRLCKNVPSNNNDGTKMHEYVKFVARMSSPMALRTKEIVQTTANDVTFQNVLHCYYKC